jgi:hypothetical protein
VAGVGNVTTCRVAGHSQDQFYGRPILFNIHALKGLSESRAHARSAREAKPDFRMQMVRLKTVG